MYGPGQNGTGEAGVVAIFAEAILDGRTPKIRGDGEQTRDYVYVDDLVEAAARAASTPHVGTWNLGTGIETSVNWLFQILVSELGFAGSLERVPLPPGEQRRSVLDGTKVRRDLGLPPYTPLEEGLRKTAEFFRAERESRAGMGKAPGRA